MPNTELKKQLQRIKESPKGKKTAVFFDFDGTVIDGLSASVFLKKLVKERKLNRSDYLQLITFSMIDQPTKADFENLLDCCFRQWKNLPEEEVRQLWNKLFVQTIAARIFPEIADIINAHIQQGHRLVFASAAFAYQIEPTAAEFGITEILATQAEVENGVLTGKLSGDSLWGSGKAKAVEDFLKQEKLSAKRAFAYANGDEDIDFLSVVGIPTAVNADKHLSAFAERNGWPQLKFKTRKKVSLADKLRTIASDAAMASTLALSATAHRAGMPKRTAVNSLVNIGSELGLSIAGIEQRVVGQHHLWEKRPAVFILNHQSPLDLLIGMNLIGRDVTGVAKKEAGDMLGWGQFMKFADMALIDRSDKHKAIAALAPAVERLKRGISVGLCPEGTRSYTPRLGKFKKGGFHIAMQAGVPIVPVVFRNTWECMQRDSLWMRSGVVDVCVHPPIDCSDWTPETLDERIAEIEKLYQDTLDNWPVSDELIALEAFNEPA